MGLAVRWALLFHGRYELPYPVAILIHGGCWKDIPGARERAPSEARLPEEGGSRQPTDERNRERLREKRRCAETYH